MEPLIGAAKAPADIVKDSDTQKFRADVIDASMTTPVIVDFWAPWCGPCKQLGPLLEKTVKSANGAVRMVKINVDENQELAAQMRIQSIPAVYAFHQGRPVDGFVGAQGESQIKAFVQRLAKLTGAALGPSPVEEAVTEAEAALQAGDHGTASAIFGEVLAHDPENAKAIAGLARSLIAIGDLAEAAAMLARVPKEKAGDAAILAAKAALDLAEAGEKASGAIPALRARIEANAKDFEARFDLAAALFAAGEREAALDHLFEIFRLQRNWNEDAARKQIVKFMEAMGPTDPLTLATRRRLSSLLFS